ncbi:hypothetical protein FVE85_1247 [Porphyridium purpureum]|uniref:Uncharacterized protein n=1 Tax=Porphyridium purpureum TaxID=35688 RepID=A0A5J4YIY3_PORPP|nr:hypothetical protein FVE85_1247 [Porphyridium purpureum]|eukprot:POR1137..scf251_18
MRIGGSRTQIGPEPEQVPMQEGAFPVATAAATTNSNSNDSSALRAVQLVRQREAVSLPAALPARYEHVEVRLELSDEPAAVGALRLLEHGLEWLHGAHHTSSAQMQEDVAVWQVLIPYRCINLHALSRDGQVCALPCVYCQVQRSLDQADVSGDCVPEMVMMLTTMKHGHVDENALQELFKQMCEMAALNPDSETSGSDDTMCDEEAPTNGCHALEEVQAHIEALFETAHTHHISSDTNSHDVNSPGAP